MLHKFTNNNISVILKLSFFVLLSIWSVSAQQSSNSYYFGHSLVNHSADQTTQKRANIPDWMYLLAEQAGHQYAADGQFGFLPLQELPALYQWGFIDAPTVRTNYNNYDFGSWDFDNVTVTLANFIQQTSTPSQSAFCDEEYWDDCTQDPNALTSVDAVLRILDYTRQAEPAIDFYIYENFPEFNGAFPTVSASQEASEFGAYYEYSRGEFHDWWVELQDIVLAERPDANVKLIPVGPILADLLSDGGILENIPANDLYEDGAPHGYPVIYFLTALIHYSVIYGEKPPTNFQFLDDGLATPIRIPDLVKNNYSAIVDFVWNELQTYTFSNGQSRVFLSDQILSVTDLETTINEKSKASPNPNNGTFNLDLPQNISFPLEIKVFSTIGQLIQEVSVTDHQSTKFNLERKGTFFLKIIGDQYSDTLQLIVE